MLVPAQAGALPGSFPYTQSALSTCTTANATATVASQTFIAIVEEKNSVKTSSWLGSCTWPYTPSASATAAPIAAAAEQSGCGIRPVDGRSRSDRTPRRTPSANRAPVRYFRPMR